MIPVDSEHSAILQCLTGSSQTPRRLILTASGGPFREWPSAKLETATVSDALNHPTWKMGAKITIDSATLVNKALEVIEAHHFFGLGFEQIEVVVHPQSIIHSMVETIDGSVLAQLGFPTMELPILYALTHPSRLPDTGVKPFDPVAAGSLTFEAVRIDAFRAFTLGVAAGKVGGTAPTIFNAANEIAVAAFLDGRIAFGMIASAIDHTLEFCRVAAAESVAEIRTADTEARAIAWEFCNQ